MPIEGTLPPVSVSHVISVDEAPVEHSQGQSAVESSYVPPDPQAVAQSYGPQAAPQTGTVAFGNGERMPIQAGQDFYLPYGNAMEITFNGQRYAFLVNPATGRVSASIIGNINDTVLFKALRPGETFGPVQLISAGEGRPLGIRLLGSPSAVPVASPVVPEQLSVSSENYDILESVDTLHQGDILPGRGFNIDDPSTFERELLTINFGEDSRARGVLNTAAQMGQAGRAGGLSDLEIAAQVAALIDDNFAPTQGSQVWERAEAQTVGFFYENGGCCRHRSALLQMALQEAGVQSRYIQGTLAGAGPHAWVEVDPGRTGVYSYVIDPNMRVQGELGRFAVSGTGSGFYSVTDVGTGRELVYILDGQHANVIWRAKNKGVKLYGGDPVGVFMQAGYDLLSDWWSTASASERAVAGTLGNIGVNIGLGLAGFALVRGYEHLMGREATGLETFAGYMAPAVAASGTMYGLAVRTAMSGGSSLAQALGSAVRPTFSSLPSGVITGLPIGLSLAAGASLLGVDVDSAWGELGLIGTTGVLSELAMMAEVGGVSAGAAGLSGAGITAAAASGFGVAGAALGGVGAGVAIDHLAGIPISFVDPDCDTWSDAIAEDPWLAAPLISWGLTTSPVPGLVIYGGHKVYQWATDEEQYQTDMDNLAAVPERLETATHEVAQDVLDLQQASFDLGTQIGDGLQEVASFIGLTFDL